MKKLLSLILACVILASFVVSANADETKNSGSKAEISSNNELVIVNPTDSAKSDFEYMYNIYPPSDPPTISISKYKGSDGEVIIPKKIDGMKVTGICAGAFKGCKSVLYVSVPNTVEDVGMCAFWGCSNLIKLDLPKSINKYFGADAVFHCKSLEDINIAKANPYFTTIDGVLFSKDKEDIVAFPPGRTGKYSVPDYVYRIDSYAFTDSSISEIIVPKTVKDIQTNFYNTSSYKYSSEDIVYKRNTKIKIYGYTNSAIEEYCKKEGFDFYLIDPYVYGDVNHDGSIDANDATLILRTSIGLEKLTAEQKKTADVNGDGSIDSSDSIDILRYSINIRDSGTRIGEIAVSKIEG